MRERRALLVTDQFDETDHAGAFAPKVLHDVIALREFGRIRPLKLPTV
jgi:hypothetical protein